MDTSCAVVWCGMWGWEGVEQHYQRNASPGLITGSQEGYKLHKFRVTTGQRQRLKSNKWFFLHKSFESLRKPVLLKWKKGLRKQNQTQITTAAEKNPQQKQKNSKNSDIPNSDGGNFFEDEQIFNVCILPCLPWRLSLLLWAGWADAHQRQPRLSDMSRGQVTQTDGEGEVKQLPFTLTTVTHCGAARPTPSPECSSDHDSCRIQHEDEQNVSDQQQPHWFDGEGW